MLPNRPPQSGLETNKPSLHQSQGGSNTGRRDGLSTGERARAQEAAFGESGVASGEGSADTGSGLLRCENTPTRSRVFEFIDSEKSNFSVKFMCDRLIRSAGPVGYHGRHMV